MKYSPRYIIYYAVSKYLSDDEKKTLKKNITKGNLSQDRRVLSEIKKVFDLERLVKSPIIKEDAWLYNYITYDMKTKFLRKGLIIRYENAIILPNDSAFQDFLRWLI